MPKLSLALLGAVISLAFAGCTVSTNNDPTGIDTEWRLFIGPDEVTCFEAAVDEVEVLSTAVGSTIGIADQFPCDDGGGFAELGSDTYTVVVTGLEQDAAVTSSVTFTQVDVFTHEITLLDADLDVF